LSIADKLNYTLETKEAIKNAIKAKGVEVTDNDTFRSYADKISSIQVGSGDVSEYFNSTISDTLGGTTNPAWTKLLKKIPITARFLESDTTGLFAYYPDIPFPKINFNVKPNFMNYMFNQCKCKNISFSSINENFDTSNVTSMASIFSNCTNVITIQGFNAKKVGNIGGAFSNCNALENLGRLENLGMAYSTTTSSNAYYYKLDLHYSQNLTHASLMNVINNLYDIATKGCKAQSLQLGATNIAKLTEEEIAIATSKGWTVS